MTNQPMSLDALQRRNAELEAQLQRAKAAIPERSTQKWDGSKSGYIVEIEHVDGGHGLAHCLNPACPGTPENDQPPQHEVPIVREILIQRINDPSSALHGTINNTMESILFADPADRACASCGADREVSDQRRPYYPPLSGHPQNALLDLIRKKLVQLDPGMHVQGAVIQPAQRTIDTDSEEFRAAVEAAVARALGNGNGTHEDDHDERALVVDGPKHKQAVPGFPGVYYKVSKDGVIYGYGVRLPRAGEPGKSDDARLQFDTPEEASEWRRNQR